VLVSVQRVRAVAAAVLLLAATAVPVLAADEPILRGSVVTEDGQPFAVDDARMTIVAAEEGGVVANRFEVAEDGSFEVPLMPWGTTAAPAQVRLSIVGVVTTVVLDDDGCSEQYAPIAARTFDVALENGEDPQPIELVAAEELVARVCGGIATPAPTLPPTDTVGGATGAGATGAGSIAHAVLVALLGMFAFVIAVAGIGRNRRLAAQRALTTAAPTPRGS